MMYRLKSLSDPSNENDFKLFLVILLLASPALSLISMIGLPFFPNEKIALIIVLMSASAWKSRFNELRLFGLLVAGIIMLLTVLQHVFGASEVSVAAINTVLVLIVMPFYISYLSHKFRLVVTYVFYIGIIQLACSLIQQIAMFNGYDEIITLFNNYPEQSTYTYPVGEMGFFFRTSGLFNESSSYAVFQWLAIFCGTLLGFHKNKYLLAIMGLMVLEVLINGSITGYVFALLYMLLTSYRKYFFWAIPLILFVLITITSSSDSSVDILRIWLKIASQFDSLDDGYGSVTRLSGGVRSVIDSLESSYMLIGSGLSWNSPTLDFISLYLRGFGLIGLVVLIPYVAIILSLGSLRYFTSACGVLMINGHLSTSINIILLSMAIVFFKYESYYLQKLSR